MPAVVLGDLDLVSALGMAGVRSVVVAQPGEPVTYSRFVVRAVVRTPGEDPAALVRRLLDLAIAEPTRPVLYYESDDDLLLVSRHRSVLSRAYRFVLPDANLVEDLVDKERFHRLAELRGLQTPRSLVLDPAQESPPSRLRFPLVIKPTTRSDLDRLDQDGKARLVTSAAELSAGWPRLRALGIPLVAQEYVEGPETSVESYHAYVDNEGRVVGEFTGRKIRTCPVAFGFSTALETTSSPDVRVAGRRVVTRLGLRGVLKVDFKRDPGGDLHLLEVNPRFNLWHHLGAAAGVNLPALVHADLTGAPRPLTKAPRPGATWCQVGGDRRAARDHGVAFLTWASWVLRTAARAEGRWSDPLPVLRGLLAPKLRAAVASMPTAPLRKATAG